MEDDLPGSRIFPVGVNLAERTDLLVREAGRAVEKVRRGATRNPRIIHITFTRPDEQTVDETILTVALCENFRVN